MSTTLDNGRPPGVQPLHHLAAQDTKNMNTPSTPAANHIEQAEHYAAELNAACVHDLAKCSHHHGRSEVYQNGFLDRVFRAPPILALPEATIYYLGETGLGYIKVEVRNLEIHEEEFAQYASTLRVSYTPEKGKKRRDFRLICNPSLVVLEGWGHPSPWDIRHAHHIANPEGYPTDFRAALKTYLSANPKAHLVRDFHNHRIWVK